MNENRRAKLKRIILKLPLGAQLLQLRRKIFLLPGERYRLKIESLRKKQKKKLKRIKEEIDRQKEIMTKRKAKLVRRIKLQDKYLYDNRCIENLQTFQLYGQVPCNQATAFEIGAGEYLTAPIGLSLLGFKRVITVDIQRAKPDYVQTVYQYYCKHKKEFGIRHVPKIKEKFTDNNLTEILSRNFNIDYRAPYDAVHTDLLDNSVDYVFSQVTFEHIRAEIMSDMVREMYRILRAGGVFYGTIDYKDHRSYSHSELTIYNYLKYTNAEWLDHDKGGSTHQNRLRTKDYQAIFTAAGFEIIKIEGRAIIDEITDADRAAFATVKVADEFKNKYTDEELMEKGIEFILRKPCK